MLSSSESDRPGEAGETAPSESGRALRWHLITCEYPPQVGGVSDYTWLVAQGLAGAGDEVHVWCPRAGGGADSAGVNRHDTLGHAGIPDLWRLGRELNRFRGGRRRLLVQWVPHGYGFGSMNLAFCAWLWGRAAWRLDEVEIMVHEPYLAFGEGSWRQNIVAILHRLMTITLLRAASRVWISIPAWEACWRPYALGRKVPFAWMPVPSNVPYVAQPGSIARLRQRYLGDGQLLAGCFGIHGSKATKQLEAVIPLVMKACPELVTLLLGKGSQECRDALTAQLPELAGRIHAAGTLAPDLLSEHLAACDLMLQPYPDGISTRRSSAMAALSHGVPLITTTGFLTEDFWMHSPAIVTVPAGDAPAFADAAARLLRDPGRRQRMGMEARRLYDARFDIRHVIAALRRTSPALES